MKKKNIYILLIISTFITINSTSAANDNNDYKEWINLGVGFWGIEPLTVNLSLSCHFGTNRLHQVAFNYNEKFTLGAYSKSNNCLFSVNWGEGVRINNRFYHISAFIGPAIVWGRKEFDQFSNFKYEYTVKDFYSIGLALNSQYFIKLIPKEMGIGFELYANINPKQTIASLRISLHLNNVK